MTSIHEIVDECIIKSIFEKVERMKFNKEVVLR